MLEYEKDAGRIEGLIKKCLKGREDLDCRIVARAYPNKEGEHWVYSLFTMKEQIGSIQYHPSNHKIKVNSFPFLPLTLGEEYKKQLEDDLQTLVDVEFVGTYCKE